MWEHVGDDVRMWSGTFDLSRRYPLILQAQRTALIAQRNSKYVALGMN